MYSACWSFHPLMQHQGRNSEVIFNVLTQWVDEDTNISPDFCIQQITHSMLRPVPAQPRPLRKEVFTRSTSLMEMRLSRPEWSSWKRCSRVRLVQGRIWHSGNSNTPRAHSRSSSSTWAVDQSQNQGRAKSTMLPLPLVLESLCLLQEVCTMEQLTSGCSLAGGIGNRPDLVPAWSLGKGVTQSRGDYCLHEASLACTQGQQGFCTAVW